MRRFWWAHFNVRRSSIRGGNIYDNDTSHATATGSAMQGTVIRITSRPGKSMRILRPRSENARVETLVIGCNGVGTLTIVYPGDRLPWFDMKFLGAKSIVNGRNRRSRCRAGTATGSKYYQYKENKGYQSEPQKQRFILFRETLNHPHPVSVPKWPRC